MVALLIVAILIAFLPHDFTEISVDRQLDSNSALDLISGRKQVEQCGARSDLYQITHVHNFISDCLHLFLIAAMAVVNPFCTCSESMSNQSFAILISFLAFTAVMPRDNTVVTATVWMLQEIPWHKHAHFGSGGELMPCGVSCLLKNAFLIFHPLTDSSL